MDPWLTGLMSIFGASNPETAGPMLDQAGLPLPMGLGGPQQQDLGSMIDPTAGTTGATTPAAATQPNSAMALAAMQGIKAPAPIQPIMNGGVTGGVKAPDVTAMKGGSPSINALMQALLQRGQPVQDLGQMIRGR